MKVLAFLIVGYLTFAIAAYGAPELKVMGVVGLIGLACLGASSRGPKLGPGPEKG